jgi:hypothetical protein
MPLTGLGRISTLTKEDFFQLTSLYSEWNKKVITKLIDKGKAAITIGGEKTTAKAR